MPVLARARVRVRVRCRAGHQDGSHQRHARRTADHAVQTAHAALQCIDGGRLLRHIVLCVDGEAALDGA